MREKESVSVYLFIYWEAGWGGGGAARWYSTNVYNGEVRPRGPTPSLFTYHFRRKRHLFLSPSIGKWNPFPIPTLKLRIPFNETHKTRMFTQIFHRHKMHLLALLGLFTDFTRNPKMGALSEGASPYRPL